MLELRHTEIGYQRDRPLVRDASATLLPGEMIALVGENGSGKSTLLRCCAGFLPPTAGEIHINHRNVINIRPQQLSRILSLVTTVNYFYENLSVFEVVALGRQPYTNWWGSLTLNDRAAVEQAIEFVGLKDLAQEPLARMSDGERQRAMIARALAQDTEILLMDEPMAFLDQPNRASVLRVLRDLRDAGKSLIYSTHEVDSIFRHADKCWLLKNNNLLEGSPEDLALADVFNDLYASHGLLFDEKETRFTITGRQSSSIQLEIRDNRKKMWTDRALSRIFNEKKIAVSSQGAAIIIKDHTSGSGWILEAGGTTQAFSTLYELSGYLIRLK
jgi:iron complex transport system ATP-binding protein